MRSPRTVYIDKGKFQRRDLLTLLKFAYAADPQETKEVFSRIGITIKDESDLELLAELHKSGGDLAGAFKVNGNQPVYFDVMKEFGKINLSHDEIKRVDFKFV